MFKNHDLHTNFCPRGKYFETNWDLKNAKSKVRPSCQMPSQKVSSQGYLCAKKQKFCTFFCPNRKYFDFKQLKTCTIQSQTFMPSLVRKSQQPGVFMCEKVVCSFFCPKRKYFDFQQYRQCTTKSQTFIPNFVQKSKQPGVPMHEKVEFLHLFFAQRGSIRISS